MQGKYPVYINYIFFFLSVSFPRTRRQANCVFRSIATRKRNETLRLWPGSAEQSEAIGARVPTQVRAFKSYNLCPDSSLRSRMTGKYLMLLRKKPFFRFCSRLPLSSANAATSPCPGTAFLYESFRYFLFLLTLIFYSSVSPSAFA